MKYFQNVFSHRQIYLFVWSFFPHILNYVHYGTKLNQITDEHKLKDTH